MSAHPSALLLCPGRGSYGREELGFLARTLRPGPVADALERADAERAAAGLPTIRELDAAPAFKPGLHLNGQNAAALIYFATMAHVETLRERFRIRAVAGNSLGWYTALAVSGVLGAYEGWLLIRTMAELQSRVSGGQILTSVVDDAWQRDPAAEREVEDALANVAARGDEFFVARSIRLGGHEVLAGTEKGVVALLEVLAKRRVGEREFPFRLAGHGPFHTALCAETAKLALPLVTALPAAQPTTWLLDGEGGLHSPWSADPGALLEWTATRQVLGTFDFSAAVRVGMREFQPDVLLCAGPGTSLRAPVGHVVLAEGWRGLRTKRALFDSGIVATA